MLKLLSSFFTGPGLPATASRPRVLIETSPEVVYAIGDIHGCYGLLRAMERAIAEDAAGVEGDKLIVVLGDVIDRGADSRQVVDHLMSAPPGGFGRIVLAGNHEQMLLDFYADGAAGGMWLDFGGSETLLSYGLRAERINGTNSNPSRLSRDMQSVVPADHIEWLTNLPSMVTLPGYVLVHAGIEPDVPLAEQRDERIMWLRWDQQGVAPLPGQTVVHGHTPGLEPVLDTGRICVDTGAFATGVLSAVRLSAGDAPRVLQVRE